ncbi:putative pentatricopeptide repeat-containing protein [Tanacetum coccineum]
MSDNIPLQIQHEIIKWLPLKPLLKFRSVSKTWKSIIDSSKFINDYHIIHKHSQRLLLQYETDFQIKFRSIVDDDTFPQIKPLVRLPDSIKLLRNPFHPETNDVKLLMVNSSIPTCWVVKVFTLSSRAWRSLSFDPPFKSCDLSWDQVSLNGFIYLHGYDDCKLTTEIRSNLIASFDLKTEMFGQVCLPDVLVHLEYLGLSKRNERLTVVEYSHEGGIGVWMIKDATTKSFTKIFTIKPRGPSVKRGLLGFRKNGEAILATLADLDDDDDTQGSSLLEVYDPCSGRINDTGIGGIESPFSVSPYTSTLLLLDQSDSLIH